MDSEYLCPQCEKVLVEESVMSGICPFCHKLFEKPIIKNLISESVNQTTPTKIANKVPKWHQGYPTLESATEEQKKFFTYWVKELKKGNALDLQGNVSYIFAYLYLIIWGFIKIKDMDIFITEFQRIENFYGDVSVGKKNKIRDYLKLWEKDAYLLIRDYDGYWECVRKMENYSLKVEEVLNYRSKCKVTSLNSSDIISLLGGRNRLPKFAKENPGYISQFINEFLNNFHQEHRKNFIEWFCSQFNFENLTGDDFLRLREFFLNNEDKFSMLKEFYEKQKSDKSFWSNRYLFGGVPPLSSETLKEKFSVRKAVISIETKMPREKPFVKIRNIPYIISEAIEIQLRRILKDCRENLKRGRDTCNGRVG